ncbi:hypothetical protein [Candidatus Clostridium stratigraminis]|uniref:Uncharacterized protein n=1 Tax=Candidatus Clostridium stratigraminis TaxID=3381661 RepID=A0ABW8T488_9CLOT
MFKKITACCLIALTLSTFKLENIYAAERIVLKSLQSNVWHQNIYLIANRLSWINYENFTVQIGDRGEYFYNFPNWHHGKYEPALYREDINGDTFEDVIVILNNNEAVPGKPFRDIHILNQYHDSYRRYEEAALESIESTISRDIKLKQHGGKVTVLAGKNKYNLDISKFNYAKPHDPYADIRSVEYTIENNKLSADISVYVLRDESDFGGLIGYIGIDYSWDGKMYKPKTLVFNPTIPPAPL